MLERGEFGKFVEENQGRKWGLRMNLDMENQGRRADKSAIIGINLSDLTMSPLRFARGQALSEAKGLAVAPDGQGDPSLRSG